MGQFRVRILALHGQLRVALAQPPQPQFWASTLSPGKQEHLLGLGKGETLSGPSVIILMGPCQLPHSTA